jgi:hypothetical protein
MFCRTTRYLNTGGLFRSHCPELLERIIALGMQVDATHFHLLQQGRSPAPRQQQQQEEGKDSDAARVARLSKLLATPSMGDDDGDDDDDSSPREEQGEEQQVAGSGAESGGGGDEGEGVVMDGRVSGVGAVRLAPRCVEYHTMVGGAGGLASCGTGSLLPLGPAAVAADGDDDGAGEHEDGAPAVAATAGGGGGDSSSGTTAAAAALRSKQRKEALATAHYDQGSVLTVDIMLADPSGFEGGQLSTLEVDGECRQHRFEQGDALVFVSHKYQ